MTILHTQRLAARNPANRLFLVEDDASPVTLTYCAVAGKP
jgi:hypothetical protein